MKEVISIILGGGRGTRLYPLTKYRAKPAVPIVGKFRLVDIPISNCLNSGLRKIWILTQFNSASLNRHIFRAYKFDALSDGFVEIIAADQAMEHGAWFQGSADAVRKCLRHLSDPRIQYVLILSGDQLYRMNFAELLQFHQEKNAQITVACNPVGKEEASELGIMGIDAHARITSFIEKPSAVAMLKDFAVTLERKTKYLASMGIYVFNKDVLMELLLGTTKVDFGRDIIPDAFERVKTYAYVYNGYWKDIGSITSFYEENLAFTDEHPPLDLFDENWHFFTRPRYLPLSKIFEAHIEKSVIAEGSQIEKARIIHSIVGLRSIIRSDTVIEDSILMGADFYQEEPALGIGKNCRLKKCIVDKNVRIGDGAVITNDKQVNEFENEYCVIRNGIIIIPKNTIIPPGTVI